MKLRTAIATATTAAILATSGVALAGATTNSGTHPSATASPSAAVKTTVRRPAVSAARLRLRLRIRKGAAAVITKTIGIDRKTLRADLASGQTIAQIATAKGVAPQTVIDALVAAATSKLDAAVSAHKITAARATKIEQKLPDRAAKLVNTWHPKRLKTTAS